MKIVFKSLLCLLLYPPQASAQLPLPAGIAPVTGGMTIATAALLVRASARRGRTHLAIDVAVSVGFVVAAAFVGVPTLAAIGAGALIGAVALGRERSTSHESSVG